MIDKIKTCLRIDDNDFDQDIQDTIQAAMADLEVSGVKKEKILETDPLILRAIKIFCKAEYATDEKESIRLKESYESLKIHLTLCAEYNS